MYIQIEFQSKELSHTSQSHLLSSPGEKTLDPHAKGLAPPLFSLQVLEHRCWNLDLHLFIRLWHVILISFSVLLSSVTL